MDIDILIKKLTNTLKNFKKSPNRRFLESTLLAKAEESNNIYSTLIELLKSVDETRQKN